MASTDSTTPTRSRRSLWIGLSVTGIALVTFAGAALSAYAHGGFGRWHRGMGHGHGHDAESVHRHLEFVSTWALEELDASEDQVAVIQPKIREAADQLLALAEEHRGQREIFHQLLTEPEIDPVALEQQRQIGLDLADRASRILVDTLAEVASELTYEQRQTLAEHAHRH